MKKKLNSDFRQLAGLSHSYDSWHRPRQVVESAEVLSEEDYGLEALMADFRAARPKIRQIASMLEDDRYGGSHLPRLDWNTVEQIVEAAIAGSISPEAAKHHIKAVQSSKIAHGERHKNAEVAHAAHKNASQLHRNAALHLRKAGDHRTADAHEKWAAHHDTHAAHAKSTHVADKAKAKSDAPKASKPEKGDLGHAATHSKHPTDQARSSTLDKLDKKDPEGDSKKGFSKKYKDSASAAPAKKDPGSQPKHLKNLKKDTVVAPKHATVHWRPGQGDEKEPTKPVNKHPHKEAHAHMIKAIKHFRSGDHDSAMKSFHDAIYHARKAPGPRARVGMTATGKASR